MSSLLTSRQAEELHKSIIAYLSANSLGDTVSVLRDELELKEEAFDEETARKYESLLEKKWTSIVRLQKKVLDLEARNASLESELETAVPAAAAKRSQDPTAWLPRAPPRHTLESHREAINCVAFHPIFSSIASGSDDYTIKIWDWEFGTLETTIKGHTRAVLDLDYGGPRNALLLASCSSDLTIKLWDPAAGYKNIRTLQGHEHSIGAVRFLRPGTSSALTGNLLASASGDQTVKIWDTTTGFCVKTLQGHTGWVRDVCPSVDGRYLLSTGNDRTIRLWDTATKDPETKLTMIGHENVVRCCAFAPAASYKYLAPLAGLKKSPPANSTAEFMASGSRDKTIKLWDARGICFLTLTGHDNWISAIVFHPGGRFIFSVADDKTLRCWDLGEGGKCVKILSEAHEQFITSLRWASGIASSSTANGDGVNGVNGEAGSTPKKGGATDAPETQFRCVIATGSMDTTLKIYAS